MNNEEAWYRIYDDQPENETQPFVVCFFWKLNVGHHTSVICPLYVCHVSVMVALLCNYNVGALTANVLLALVSSVVSRVCSV